MTILYKECGYFNEEIDDPYSPYPYECEDCYRYEICLRAKENEETFDLNTKILLTNNLVAELIINNNKIEINV